MGSNFLVVAPAKAMSSTIRGRTTSMLVAPNSLSLESLTSVDNLAQEGFGSLPVQEKEKTHKISQWRGLVTSKWKKMSAV